MLFLQLAHHFLYIVEIPPGAQSSERSLVLRNLRMAIEQMASCARLARHHLYLDPRLLYRDRNRPIGRHKGVGRELLRVHVGHHHHRVLHPRLQGRHENAMA